jgi:hypothetical protein
MPDKFVRLSDEAAAAMLEQMAREDLRKEGAMVAWLIRKEFTRRALTEDQSVSAETVSPALSSVEVE